MKAKKAFVSLTVLLMLLHSCTSGVKENGNSQWLQGSVCQFPCWENIVPQETLFDDVFPTLRKRGIEASIDSESEISFRTKDDIDGSISKATDGTVDLIILWVSEQGPRLDDIVQILGSPGKIAFIPNPIHSDLPCVVRIVFPNHGTILELYLENYGPESTCEINVNSASQLSRILLIGSNFDKSEFWQHPSYADLDYVEWKGYGEYP